MNREDKRNYFLVIRASQTDSAARLEESGGGDEGDDDHRRRHGRGAERRRRRQKTVCFDNGEGGKGNGGPCTEAGGEGEGADQLGECGGRISGKWGEGGTKTMMFFG